MVILHLPIGALVFLALFRCIPSLRHPQLQAATTTLWVIAAITTVCAAITGWALIWSDGNDWGQLGVRHQWLGTALAVVVLLSCLLAMKRIHPISDSGLAIATILMVITAHHGGSMTHGTGHLWGGNTTKNTDSDEAHSPQAEQHQAIIEPQVDPSLWTEANAIFQKYCIDCHNSNRRRGYFDMSSHEEIFKGGSSGQAVIPGDPKRSLMMKLIILPEDHFDRMPPDVDPLSPDEVSVIRNWIRAGAPDQNGQIVQRSH